VEGPARMMFLRGVAIGHDRLEATATFRCDVDDDSCSMMRA